GSVNFPLTPILYRRPGRGGTVHGTWTMSPTFFNQFILGVSQNKLFFYPEFPERVSRKGTGIDLPQWNPDVNPGGLLPNMTFSSVPNYANPSMSNGVPYYNANTIFSFVDNLSKVLGTHMLKFGVYVERTRKDQSGSTTTRGALSFGADRNNPLDTNYAYAAALMGIYTNYSESNARPQGMYRFTNFEWYAQDAWRIRRTLLIDFGVRFYRNRPQYDARNQLASFVPGLWDPAKAPVLLRPAYNSARVKVALDPLTGRTYSESLIGTFVPGVGNPADGMVVAGQNGWPRGMYEGPGLALAPRIGFAWDPFGRGRTAIRGGGGVFFDRIQGNPTMGLIANPPTVLTPTVYFGYLGQIAENAGKGILAPSTATGMIGKHPMPTVCNFSFGVQQQIGRRIIADVSYVGSLSRHFLWQRDVNAIPIGAQHYDLHPENLDPTTGRAFSANFLRPLQGWGSIEMYEFASTASYNSLQASVQRRMHRGIQIGFAYTFSKVLGTAASDTTNVSAFFDPRTWNYGPLSHDRTHVASLRYNWILPRLGRRLHSKAVGRLADGWEISGISRFMTGAPYTPGYSLVSGQDITGTATEGARINILDPQAPPLEGRFGPPARGTFGNAGVGIMRQPGMNNWDISLFRSLKIGERRTAQLRLETYNTFNHTQFNSLNTTARFDAQAQQIDPTFLEPRAAYGPRRVQLALRVNW
ncbi:MAG: hypothetical protein HY822_16890, partial [Acidobacteria bacterium]|nr:hypothetical protein [Acidobacteriota bacterium]